MKNNKICVVIPFYNEEKLIIDTLNSLKNQTDKYFRIVLVNNNSTDKSVEIVDGFFAMNPEMDGKVITEPIQGTGVAADTGFRYAIETGADLIARIDADAVADQFWLKNIRQHFQNGARIIGGKIRPRKDEEFFRFRDSLILPFLLTFSGIFTRILYRYPEFRYALFMVPGLNMAIESDLYIEAGGFPRSRIKEVDEDRELNQNVCRIIDKEQAHSAKDVLVFGSTRRVYKYGYVNTLLWYWNRKYQTDEVDIRI